MVDEPSLVCVFFCFAYLFLLPHPIENPLAEAYEVRSDFKVFVVARGFLNIFIDGRFTEDVSKAVQKLIFAFGVFLCFRL